METQASSGLGTSSQIWDRRTFGAAVVSTTLDYMNRNENQNRMNNSYDFQKSVLGAAYTGKGTLADTIA
ncbi:MAG: hypothetical protein EOL86_12035 [Deltaproteobacteria bacterium]|nr:hypothetical protein [Deltaproteobacteria bacterium]